MEANKKLERHKKYLTTGDVARACEVSLVALKRWIRNGKLKAFSTPGGHLRISVDEFHRFRTAYGFPSEAEEPLKVLVVDDNSEMVRFIFDAFRADRPGAKLEAAFDGYEGLIKVGTFHPHLLILDLRMPGLDGFQVCRKVKADPITRSIKILAVTAYLEDNARERILEAGADGFLPKPFQLAELTAEVARLVGLARQTAKSYDSRTGRAGRAKPVPEGGAS